jgi:hypothetical protein
MAQVHRMAKEIRLVRCFYPLVTLFFNWAGPAGPGEQVICSTSMQLGNL